MSDKYNDYSKLFKPNEITIKRIWSVFAKFVLPEAVSDVQYLEMQKAFYAGFFECFKIMSDYAAGLPEDDACEMFNRLANESHEFHDSKPWNKK